MKRIFFYTQKCISYDGFKKIHFCVYKLNCLVSTFVDVVKRNRWKMYFLRIRIIILDKDIRVQCNWGAFMPIVYV